MPTPDFATDRIPAILLARIQALGLVPIVTDLARTDAAAALWNQLLAASGTLTLVTITDSTTIVNQAAETAFIPAGTQQFAFPAGALNLAGRRVEFSASGTMACTGTPTMLLHARLGGIAGDIVGISSAVALANNSTAAGWKFEGGFTVRTVGAAANLRAENARFSLVNATANAGAALDSLGNGAVADVVADLTAALAFVISADWSAADAANIISMTSLVVKVVG